MTQVAVAFVAVCFFAGSFIQECHAEDSRPNIIFLLADDLASSAVGYNGNKEVITPHIDKLAAEGIIFDNFYTTTAICMASRATMLTGMYEYKHGCNFGHGDLERRFMEQSYPVLLRRAGYYTGINGKSGLFLQGEPFEALEPFFDDFTWEPVQSSYRTKSNVRSAKKYAKDYPHASRASGAWGQDFIKAAVKTGKPFCMSVSFKAPHTPYTPDPIDYELYQGKTFARPKNYGKENGKHLSPHIRTSRPYLRYQEWIDDFDAVAAKYYALVTGVDVAVGMIRAELERQGVHDNTVIIFTSDNGYNNGSHGFGDKILPYEEASRVPMIIYDPRLPADKNGRRSNALTGNIDMAVTMLALAGESAPPNVDGKSLIPLCNKSKEQVHDYLPLFNMYGSTSAQVMSIVTPEWKYIHWWYGAGMKPTEELFHLTKDPIEMTNVASNPEYEEMLARAQKNYDEHFARMNQDSLHKHGYAIYQTYFNRVTAWDEKAETVLSYRYKGVGENTRKTKPKQVE